MPQPASTEMNQNVVGMTINVDRGEHSDHHHEDAKVDDKPPHDVILGHQLNFAFG